MLCRPSAFVQHISDGIYPILKDLFLRECPFNTLLCELLTSKIGFATTSDNDMKYKKANGVRQKLTLKLAGTQQLHMCRCKEDNLLRYGGRHMFLSENETQDLHVATFNKICVIKMVYMLMGTGADDIWVEKIGTMPPGEALWKSDRERDLKVLEPSKNCSLQ